MARFAAGTVTLVFSDIDGSTRLLQELGDRYAEALADHGRVVRADAEPLAFGAAAEQGRRMTRDEIIANALGAA